MISFIFKLKDSLSKKQKHKNLSLLSKKLLGNGLCKKGSLLVYTISFSFSAMNTFLYISDALGNLEYRYSAGLVNFRGKQKK